MANVVFCLARRLLLLNILFVFCEVNNEDAGHATGFLSYCPGVTKPVKISRTNLKYLAMIVLGKQGIRNKYNYHQMKQLAKDPGIDFKNRMTVIHATGYLESSELTIITGELGQHYKTLNYNVLILDYAYFNVMQYPLAARIVKAVGFHVAEMLVQLTGEGLDPKRLEVVGVSLGAHAGSFAAKYYRNMTGATFSRITGLDPAGPCFRLLGPDKRLDKTDADFVDILATNIDFYGMGKPVGHVNIYVNGGENQPMFLVWFSCTPLCSHIRAYSLWVSALKYPNFFIAIQCNSVQDARERKCYNRSPLVTNLIGLRVDKSKHGVFYLATDYRYPYYMGQKGLKAENYLFATKLESINSRDLIRF